MALRKLRTVEDEILRKISKPVKEITEKTHQLLDDMLETMYHEKGIGLAAVQIGMLKRILVMDIGEDEPDPVELINPRVIHSEGCQAGREGCLSIPGISGEVERPVITVIKAQNRHGEEFEMHAEGRLAVVLNHELDHLDGILYTDKAVDIREDEDDEE